MLTASKIVDKHKAQIEALHDLSRKSIATAERIAQLNVQSAKSALQAHAEHAQGILTAHDFNGFANLQQYTLKPMAEKAVAYNRHLFEIAADLGRDVSHLAETQLAAAQSQFVSALETAMKSMPFESEPTQAIMKNALTHATTAMDAVQQAFKQSAETAQAKLAAFADVAPVKAAAKATKSRKSA